MIIENITAKITAKKTTCQTILFTSFFFLAPINLEIIEIAPIVKPSVNPINILKTAVINPIADKLSTLNPDTQILLIKEYKLKTNIFNIIDIDNFLIAFSGFPRRI
jgi:hypothetical protein